MFTEILSAAVSAVVGARSGLVIAAIVGVAATAAGTGAVIWHHQVYQSGYDAALSDVAEENAQAIGRAVAKRSVWQDCKARDGQWDQSTGRCL